MNQNAPIQGLDNVIVAHTALAHIDGEKGELLLAGQDVAALCTQGFSSTAALLLNVGAGNADAPIDLDSVEQLLASGRQFAFRIFEQMGRQWRGPVGRLQSMVAQLPENLAGLEWVGAVGALAAYAACEVTSLNGAKQLMPNENLPHIEDLLRLFPRTDHAKKHAPQDASKALSAYLAAISEHGLNASTFAARVVASTSSDAVSCLAAAIGALKGLLHGGAPGPVLDMLDEVGTAENASSWLQEKLHRGERIMGMGHRVYRARDPRAALLENVLLELLPDSPRLTLARVVEKEALMLLKKRYPSRALYANVEFATALLLDGLGFQREHFTLLFAAGRAAGWVAHICEQQRVGRLLRPRAVYNVKAA